MAAVLLCEHHGVCRVGFRKKACMPFCTIKRSDRCQDSVHSERGWGFQQCTRKPVKGGQGYCGQHAKLRRVLSPADLTQARLEWARMFYGETYQEEVQ